MLLHTSLQWLRRSMNHSLNPQSTSHISPWRASYGMYFVRMLRENWPRYNGNALSFCSDNAHWVGCRDVQVEGIFRWEDGTLSNWNNWDSDQPNGETDQNCVSLETSKKWQDKDCTESKRYICMSTPSKIMMNASGTYLRVIGHPTQWNHKWIFSTDGQQ